MKYRMNMQKVQCFIFLGPIFLFALVFTNKIFAQSNLIQNDISKMPWLTAGNNTQNAQTLNVTRLGVQTMQNTGIGAGLYQLGLPPAAPGSPAVNPALNIFNAHFVNGFCDPSSPNEGGNGYNCQSGDPALVNGDIKISTLLTGSAYLNPAQIAAAKAFVSNVIDPFPTSNFQDPSTMTAAKVLASPNLQQDLAQALVREANLSVARQPFMEMINKRTVPQTGASGITPESMMQTMEREATQRILNPQWMNTMATAYATALKTNPSQAVQYDMAAMQAYLIWLEFERFKQGERIEALLAALLQQQVALSGKGTQLLQQAQSASQPKANGGDQNNQNQQYNPENYGPPTPDNPTGYKPKPTQ